MSIAKLCICIEFLIIQNTASNFPFDEELYYQNVLNCKTLGFQQKIFSHISTISEQKLISANLVWGVRQFELNIKGGTNKTNNLWISLYSNILYSIILYSIILYSIILYSIILYLIILYSIILYSNILYSIILYSIILYSIILYSIHFLSLWRNLSQKS